MYKMVIEKIAPNIVRGKKWTDLRARHTHLKHDKEIEWMDNQKNIVEDEKAYADSINLLKRKSLKRKLNLRRINNGYWRYHGH